jgi:hypothetical protein
MNASQASASKFRWVIISAAFIIMMVISIYQYSWFLFAYMIENKYAWNPAAIGMTFTVFAYAATFVQPFSGFIADSYGPRKMALAASFLVGIGFILCSFVSTPHAFYLYYGLGGLGVGVLYGIATACAVKWFPDRRGFAAGLVVFGFGAGTAIFNFFIQALLASKGLSSTFLWVGSCMLIILVPLSLLLSYPAQEWSPPSNSVDEKSKKAIHYKPVEMLKTYQWFLIYFSFAGTVSIVLMSPGQRVEQSLCRCGLRQDRQGKNNDVVLLRAKPLHLCLCPAGAYTRAVCHNCVYGVITRGGSFCTVSSDDRRLLWSQVLHDKLRHYLYRQSVGRINIRLVERVPSDKIWFLPAGADYRGGMQFGGCGSFQSKIVEEALEIGVRCQCSGVSKS